MCTDNSTLVSEVISVRVKKEVLKKIDELVSLGVFSSRNEVLNFLILQGLKEADKWKAVIEKSKRVKVPLLDKGLEEFLKEREDRY